MKVGKGMLVSEYFEGTVSNRPYKYQTKINMVNCLKRLGLWDMEYTQITPNLCWERIDSHFNMNVKRVYAGVFKQVWIPRINVTTMTIFFTLTCLTPLNLRIQIRCCGIS